MANRFLSNIRINDAYTFPASDGTNGQILSTNGSGSLSFIDSNTSIPSLSQVLAVGNTSGANNILMADSQSVNFGAGNDLIITHDGTNSIIGNITGNLYIRNDADDADIVFQSDNGSGGRATYFQLDGSLLRTSVFKDMRFNDDVVLQIGTSADLRLYHDATDSFIENNTGDLFIRQNTDDADIYFQSDNGSGGRSTYMYLDGSITETRFTVDTRHNDNIKAKFGDGQDLQIYHDGSNSFINNTGTGSLLLKSNSGGIYLKSIAGDTLAQFINDGAVNLYYDNSIKFATTSTGVSVTGNGTFSGSLDVNGTGNNTFTGNIIIDNAAPILQVNSSNNASGFRINITGIADSTNSLLRVQRSGTTMIDTIGNGDTTFTGVIIGQDDGSVQTILRRTSSGTDGNTSIKFEQPLGDGYLGVNASGALSFGTAANLLSNNKFAVTRGGNASFSGSLDVNGTGENTFTGNVRVDSANPIVLLNESDQTANNRLWGFQVQQSLLKIRAYPDDLSSAVDALTLTRTGNATFASNVNIATGGQLFFDNGGNTYISEDIADRLRFFVGGAEFMRFTEDTADTITFYKNSTFTGTLTADLTGVASNLTVTTNDTFSGTYPLMWHAGTDIYSSSFMTINGSTDTLSVPNISTSANLTVGGNLIVNGTTTTLNTQTVEVEDNILQLNTTQGSPDTATAVTSGISIYRGDGVTQASLIFDDADDTWDLTNNLALSGGLHVSVASTNNLLTLERTGTSPGKYKIYTNTNSLFIHDDAQSVTRLKIDGTGLATFDKAIRSEHSSSLYSQLESNSSGGVVKGTGGGGFFIRSYGVSYFNGGFVGFGTSDPLEKLHVMYGDTAGIATEYSKGIIEDTDAQFDLLSTSAGTWGSSLNFVESAGGNANTDVWSIARKTTGGSGDSSLNFNFGTNNRHDNTNRVSFSSGGNVTAAAYYGDGSNLTNVATATNADTVDSLHAASFLRSDADDSFSGGLASTVRDEGIFGTYDSTKTDHIWSMGTAYKISSTGADFGNLYGLSYYHPNNATNGEMGGGHQMVWCANGTPKSAMGSSLWTAGSLFAAGGIVTGTFTMASPVVGSSAKIQFQNNDFIRYDDAANTWHFDVDGGTSNGSLQAATFTGTTFAGNLDGTFESLPVTDFFTKGADIGGSVNLNNYTTPGYFHQDSNSNATSGSNYPANVAGMLTVTSDGVFTYQTYQGYGANHTYERKYYNGTWYAWHQIYDSGVFTNNSANWNTAYGWGNHASAGYLTQNIVNDAFGLFIKTSTNGAGARIRFSDQVTSYAQQGDLVFYHSDGSSEGSAASFHFQSTEPQLSVVAGDSNTPGKFYSYSQADTGEVDFGFAGDTNTGMYRPAADQVGLVAGASRKLLVSSTGVSVQNGVLNVPGGSVTAPSIGVGDTDTGFYDSGSNSIGISSGGVKTAEFLADGQLALIGADPTISLIDTGASDDFYIHVNSNNFYVLRDTAGADGVGGGWDNPHPLQLEGDTNIGLLFGQRMFADNYHPNADQWTTGRTLTIGDTGKAVTGGADVAWSVAEIGATPINDVRSLGTTAFTGTANTAGFISEIEADGAFDSFTSFFKHSWSYAGNDDLTDGGRFTETAGASFITWTDNSSDSARGNITVLAIAPNTGGSAGKMFVYNDQGSSYSPGWREIWTSRSDGDGSGLDADLLDGYHQNSFTRKGNTSANDTGNITTFNSNDLGSSTGGDQSSLQIYNETAQKDAFLTFHISGDYAGYFGLDGATNDLFWGGWSVGGTKHKIWHAGNDGSGSGLDADTVDGISSGSFIRSDADDTFTGKLVVGSSSQRRAGMYGIYNSSLIGHIWSMGTAYQIPENGANFGNLYGLAYKHTNNSTGGTMAGGHQMVWCSNGTGKSAIGDNIWTDGIIDADGASFGGTVVMNGQTISMGNGTITGINHLQMNDPGVNEGIGWSGGNGWYIQECPDNMTNAAGNLQFSTGTTRRVTMTTGGTLNATGDVIAYSDRRVKDNIQTIDNALETVSNLRGVSYNRNDVEDKSKKIGVIAQEVEGVLPEVVQYSEDADVYSVAYGNMAGLFIEAIKELKAEVLDLKNEIKMLKNK
jgi:hypothetical protein